MCSVASRISNALEAPRWLGLGLRLRTVPLVEVALHGRHQVGCGVKVALAVAWHRSPTQSRRLEPSGFLTRTAGPPDS